MHGRARRSLGLIINLQSNDFFQVVEYTIENNKFIVVTVYLKIFQFYDALGK